MTLCPSVTRYKPARVGIVVPYLAPATIPMALPPVGEQ